VVCDLETHDQTCRFLAERSGAQVISVDYRLAPEHPFPAPVLDAVAAFTDVVERAAGWGIDPARVAVGGDSAGGHLSAAVALETARRGGPAPAFQLLIYPVTDSTRRSRSYHLFGEGFFLTDAQMHWYREHFLPEGVDRSDPLVSPLLADLDWLGQVAPAYVATAGFDPLRDEGEAYATRLRQAGAQVSVRRHPGLVHGFANLVGFGRVGRLAMAEAAGALTAGLA
jgi:acetyl esterase